MMKNSVSRKLWFSFQLFSMLSFADILIHTDSLYSNYLLIGLIGVFSMFRNTFSLPLRPDKRKTICYSLYSFLFLICVLLANYTLWKYNSEVAPFLSASRIILVGFGSLSIAWNILLFIDGFVSKDRKNPPSKYPYSLKKTIIITFVAICGIYTLFAFVVYYPGILTPDSISQIRQIMSEQYSNHHPFWHTMIIKLWMTIGLKLFGEINAAVACYSAFQILFMSICFAYCIATMYEAKTPQILIVISLAFYALMPYHILYSITMWKDIPYAGAVLLFVSALFRILHSIGTNRRMNNAVLFLGAFGMCLWRSNGIIAFALTLIVFSIMYFKKYKKLSLILFAILCISYFMTHPLLSYMGIKQPDTIESLSIPAQQISRVVVANGNISDKEKDLLNEIIDIEKIPDEYKSYISDPIKELVREKNNQEFLNTHKADYLKLWISVGIKNPLHYISAWIEQTKGYWNGGYKYPIWAEGIYDNEFGIKHSYDNLLMVRYLISLILSFMANSALFNIFRSIGLTTWIITACFFLCIANRRGKQAILTIPLLANIATLLIATPVYSEFRYAYASFTCLPLIICATVYKSKDIPKTE